MKYNQLLVKNDRFVVCISYGDYMVMHGGVNRYLLEYSKILMDEGISIIFVYPKTIKNPRNQELIVKKYGCKIDEKELGISVDMESILHIINANIKQKKRLNDIHIQHLKDIDLADVYMLVNNYNTPIKFFLHDYYCLCSNQLLLNDEKKFCKVDEANCKKCIHGTKRNEHFFKYKQFFTEVSDRVTIISPSECAKNVWKMAFGDINKVEVLEHQTPEVFEKNKRYKNPGDKITVAYLGNSRYFKGYEYWTSAIKKHNEKVCFMEYSDAKKSSDALLKKGFFSKDNLMFMRDKMKSDGVNIVVLWSIWPETYSYTFFEALEAETVIVTNDEAGNIPNLVRKYNCGVVLDRTGLDDILSDYDYLVKLYNDKQSNVGYKFKFNRTLIHRIQDVKSYDEGKYEGGKIKDYKVFSFVYRLYNWLRIKVIKI